MFYDLTRDDMAAYVNTHFAVLDVPEAAVALQLTEVTPRQTIKRQEMFSLLFQGPEDSFLAQRMYKLQHQELGEFYLSLVPVGREKEKFIYEAVFNRFIKPS